MAMSGNPSEGIGEIRHGIEMLDSVGARVRTVPLAMLAECHLIAREIGEGLQVLAAALAHVEETGEAVFASELNRLRGELLLMRQPSETADAEAAFRTAIEVSRGQAAKWWELRATTSLARLLAKQGRRTEARAMLADIYGWFTEGFDTTDLKDAKALLDQLGG